MSEQIPRRAYVPPAVDPMSYQYPMKKPAGCFTRLFQLAVIGFAAYGLYTVFEARQGAGAASLPPSPPAAASPTLTAIPAPTRTPVPGEPTVVATQPPVPSVTPLPPGVIVTWTPGPWLGQRWQATYEALYGTSAP